MDSEIIIIGGGIAGCSAAYFLARRGQKVTLLEKNSGIGLEASGRNACGVRQQGRKAALPLSILTVKEIWSTLAQELDADLEYRQVGNLKLRLTEDDVKLLEEETTWEHANGLPEVSVLSGDECRKMVTGLSPRILAGKYCPTDGIANPMLVPPAIARGAQRLGAKIITDTQVTGLLIHGSAVHGVKTDRGDMHADVVINAAGPWASRFNEMAGCKTPIQPGMSQLMITECLPHMVTTWTSPGYTYFLQTKSGNLVIGISGKPNFAYRKRVDYPDIVQKAGQIIELLPQMVNYKFIRAFSGITEYTPDKQPYIGAVPGISGYYTLCGFHGEGFCLGPGAGRVMAELVTGNTPSVSLEAFNPGRFTELREVGVYHSRVQTAPVTN